MESFFCVFQKIGERVTGEELHDILGEVDLNKNGQVDLGEFLQVSKPNVLFNLFCHKILISNFLFRAETYIICVVVFSLNLRRLFQFDPSKMIYVPIDPCCKNHPFSMYKNILPKVSNFYSPSSHLQMVCVM